ncbi:hypothetical protein CN504_17585 [Bacillus anthracis]|uniref:hypothetical protein n=1 Tax=Bacillus TaxID=1386 RepID=UPI000775BDE1|nr:hypothetical protein [Bacillus sp. BF9-10]KXO03041.1 hypothetical protein AYK81_29010 [Bacillus thuringiensis]PES81225.1 hypothetical protein CN504_17585 [Bacillus anthracis]PEZ18653.1 hypothetical protein CN337_20480 [Bacillus anthracis]TXR71606.1 hypothetical protein DN396_29695 [Bacillus sp. BF9-10]
MFKKLVLGALATGLMLSGATGASAAVDTDNSKKSIAASCDYKAFPYAKKEDMPMVVIKDGIKHYLKGTVTKGGQLYGLYEPEYC